MRRKGLSIFQKLFIAFLGVGLITLIISGMVHYKSKKEFVARTITSQLSDSLHASTNYFHSTFTIPIKKDLGFIEKSPSLNNFLTSQKAETLLMKPPAERLFLYFTGMAESIYLSSRFIDSKGKERIVTAGNRRTRDYAAIGHFPNNELYQRIYSLFERLKVENVGSILFEGPFKYKNDKFTFVIGISKMEPEIGGFGGAVIFHCDLTAYLNYLSDIKFHQAPIAFVFSPDNHVMLSPEKEASFDPVLYLSKEENINNSLVVSSSVKLGSNNDVLLNFVLSIPQRIFSSELKKVFIDLALVGMAIIILVGFIAVFMSMRLFAKPIKELSRGAKRIGKGDLDYRIKIETHDEIAQLADEFNQMTESLKKITVSRNILSQEVDERKRAEELLRDSETRFKELFRNIHSGVAVYEATENGADFVFKDFNRAAEKIESKKKEELIGKSVLKVFPGVREFGLFDVFQRVWKSGQPEHYPVSLYQDGRVAGWRENFVYKLSSGEIVTVYTDETEHKQAEEERKKLETQLQQVQKMESIGTLAGGIAHDFNNMLGIIVGNAELAMDDVPEWNPARNNLNEIRTASLRARDVVKQILAFSRLSLQEMKPVRISPIIKESLKLLRSSIPTTIEIHQDISNESDTVRADPTQINQVLINLCTNAAHAIGEKGGVLEVNLNNFEIDEGSAINYHDLSPGEYVRLTVSDTGYGIEPKLLERIFDPYFTTKGVGEGSGMGLSVVHGIVKTHGGDILVDSELGKGTTFQVFFPCTESKPEPEIEIAVEIPRGNESILFIDDEKAMVDAIQPMIERLGYKVTARTSSIEGLEAFRANPDRFDLVITDFTMPNMTGMELARKLLKLRSDILIILCTGYSEHINEDKAKGSGIRAFVMKPVVLDEIANTIRKVLDKE